VDKSKNTMQTLNLTKKYEKYSEYKDSGVEWLGEIPKEWEAYKLRNALRSNIVDGPHETPDYVDEGIPFISVDSIGEDEKVNLDIVKKFITEEQYNEYNKKTKLTKNDILFTKAASIGRVAIVDDRKFMTWSPLAIIKPEPRSAYYKYLFYVLKSEKFVESVVNSCSFNTQLNIGMKVLEKSMIAVPRDIVEQTKIADYLDNKTEMLDQIIEKKQKQIELLREKRTAVINNAITKGLNPKLELVESSIDWIGKIPKEWGVEKLKNKTTFLNGYSFNSDEYVDDGLPIIRISDVGQDVDFLQVKRVPYAMRDKIKKFLVRKDDLLIALTGGTIGKTSIYNKNEEIYLNQRVGVIRPNKQLILGFLKFQIASNIFKKNIELFCIGGAQPNIGKNEIGNIYFAFPDKPEQEKIVLYLDKKINNYNKALNLVEKSIETLQEFKFSLISNVVTGKIKINS